jgi:Uma2 family endonuclease
MSVADVAAELGEEVLRPLRRAEYDQLVALGVFDDEPVELLEGVLVEMSPEGPPHGGVVEYLNRLLARGLPEHLSVRVAAPYAASDISEPEPDLAIVEFRYPRSEHPDRSLLLIEVANSSRRKDLGVKARVYARAGVPAYWVVDVAEQVVHVHTEPGPDGYASVTRAGTGAVLDAAGVAVDLGELFPAT